jgi:hypothetical protein
MSANEERLSQVADAYEASKLAVQIFSDLDAYTNHDGPYLCEEHQKLVEQFLQGDDFRNAALGLAMAFARTHFPSNLPNEREPPKPPFGPTATMINTMVEMLVPTPSGRFHHLDLERRKRIVEEAVAKEIAQSPTVKAQQHWRKPHPIQAVIAELITQNRALLTRIETGVYVGARYEELVRDLYRQTKDQLQTLSACAKLKTLE